MKYQICLKFAFAFLQSSHFALHFGSFGDFRISGFFHYWNFAAISLLLRPWEMSNLLFFEEARFAVSESEGLLCWFFFFSPSIAFSFSSSLTINIFYNDLMIMLTNTWLFSTLPPPFPIPLYLFPYLFSWLWACAACAAACAAARAFFPMVLVNQTHTGTLIARKITNHATKMPKSLPKVPL